MGRVLGSAVCDRVLVEGLVPLNAWLGSSWSKLVTLAVAGGVEPEEMNRSVLKEERRRLYEKRRRRRDQVFANSTAELARRARALRVSAVFLGGLRGLAQDKPGKGNTNMWNYRRLKQRLAITLENHGIAVFEVPEDNTSKTCTRHGCEVVRKPRGLVRCPYGHVMHSDINAAMNILARGGGRVPARVKVLSFILPASKVVPVNGKDKNSNPAPSAG